MLECVLPFCLLMRTKIRIGIYVFFFFFLGISYKETDDACNFLERRETMQNRSINEIKENISQFLRGVSVDKLPPNTDKINPMASSEIPTEKIEKNQRGN